MGVIIALFLLVWLLVYKDLKSVMSQLHLHPFVITLVYIIFKPTLYAIALRGAYDIYCIVRGPATKVYGDWWTTVVYAHEDIAVVLSMAFLIALPLTFQHITTSRCAGMLDFFGQKHLYYLSV